MNRFFFPALASLLLLFPLPGMAEVKFIKYKTYLIPIPVETGACEDREIPSFAVTRDSGDARVIVSSDMAGGTTSRVVRADPDDIQSLVHMLTFADKVDIEGIMTGPDRSAVDDNDNEASRDRIEDIISAYGRDRTLLTRNYGSDFPEASDLASIVIDGSRSHHPINSTPSYSNDAVKHVIKQARCAYHDGDLRPLYLLAWGSSTDFSQAIFEAPDIKRVVRLVSYSFFNNGNFTQIGLFNGLSCSEGFGNNDRCSSWNYLRSQVDLWWVDYTGRTLPMLNCSGDQTRDIIAGGDLGGKIVDSSVTEPNGNGCGVGKYLKLGDSWTLMFTHNPASQRDNPTSNSDFGDYYRPQAGRQYWQLFSEKFDGLDDLYRDWVGRASNL